MPASRKTKLDVAKLRLLRGGQTKQEIANRLGLELETVERIAANIELEPQNAYDFYRNPNPCAA